MKVSEAIKDLTESLGIAMGANAAEHSHEETPKTGGTVGDSLHKAHVDMKSDDAGHSVTIKFDGEQQPEAAQTTLYILTKVMDDLGIEKTGNLHRTHTKDFDGKGREISFSVSKGKKDEFVTAIKTITEAIRNAPELQDQYKTAADFAAEYVKPIDGVKPHFKLNASHASGPVPEGSEPAPGPHFELQLEGVPTLLAHQIAEKINVNPDSFEDSPARKIEGRPFRGGKSVKIDLSSPDRHAAFDAVRTFSERVSHIPGRESTVEIGASA